MKSSQKGLHECHRFYSSPVSQISMR
jgi:hypothetical protein